MTKRKSLSKKVRFEIFKRDSFTCQYCGCEAPSAILQIDHILPVKEGGTNDLTNLVTACQECNAGKGARELDDDTAIKKQKCQLDALQSRREQLQMMMEWHRSLASIDDEMLESAAQFWEDAVPGYYINELGRNALLRSICKYGLNEVLAAIHISTQTYLRYDPQSECPETPTQDSADKTLDYVGRICEVSRRADGNPDIQRLYYIRGILKNKLNYLNQWMCIDVMQSALDRDIPVRDIESLARRCGSWSQFRREVAAMEYGTR